MCFLRKLYYSYWLNYYNKVEVEWNKLDKTSGICSHCNKYSQTLTINDNSCYKCFEYYFDE